MSLSRAEQRRDIRDRRRKLLKKTFWIAAAVIIAGLAVVWLWEWTGEPALLD